MYYSAFADITVEYYSSIHANLTVVFSIVFLSLEVGSFSLRKPTGHILK